MFYVAALEYMPNKIFIFLFRIKVFNMAKKKNYKYPIFLNNRSLQNLSLSNSGKLLKTSIKLFNNYQENSENNIFQRQEKYHLVNNTPTNSKSALIIIPNGWTDPLTDAGRTQGPQILFLTKGLEENGFVTKIIEIKNNFRPNISDTDVIESELIFIWSLTSLSPKNSLFDDLNLTSSKSHKLPVVVGVLTASPNIDLISHYKSWNEILTNLVYFEEKSEFKNALSDFFNIKHVPYIQLTPKDFKYTREFSPSIHASCLLKQNRVSWLLILRYMCISLKFDYLIRLISNALSYKNIKESYIPNEAIADERSKFGLGFVMVHRNPKDDAHLIGSFWDYYRLGVIPLIQMQKMTQIASYMTPYLDYFPIESDADLFAVLEISKNNLDHFNNLRLRIINRMENEFIPSIVVKNILSDFKV